MIINLNGVIVSNDDKFAYDWWGTDSISPKDVSDLIAKAKGERLDIRINSGGGDIVPASEIRSMLRLYQGEKNILVQSFAGSAASVISTVGHSEIEATALYMIHNVSSGARGDYNAMDKMSEILKQANKSIVAAYMEKTGMSEKELLTMMNKETWLTAKEAVELKFIDKIAENQNVRLAASYGTGLLPQQVINRLRNEMQDKKSEDATNEKDIIRARLNLLNLGGIRI